MIIDHIEFDKIALVKSTLFFPRNARNFFVKIVDFKNSFDASSYFIDRFIYYFFKFII